jgi:hypothetical protein
MTGPVKKFFVAGINVAIWENELETESGARKTNSVSIDRRYKDKNGEWKSTNSLKAQDIPKAILGLQKAYEFISLKEAESA